MRSTFVSMCFMVALAALTSSLPHMAGNGLNMHNGNSGAAYSLLASGQQMAKSAGIETANIVQTDERAKNEMANMTPEEQKFYRENSDSADLSLRTRELEKLQAQVNDKAEQDEKKAKLTALESITAIKEQIMLAEFKMEENKKTIAYIILGIPAFFLALGALCGIIGFYQAARTLGGISFWLMFVSLMLLSVSMLACQVMLGLNCLRMIPSFLWTAPACMLILSALFMRLIDINYPFWNTSLRALSMPLICTALALSWDKIHSLFMAG